MFEDGWVTEDELLVGGGALCLPCAHLLRIARYAERCAWCAVPLGDEAVAESQGWLYFADTLGELHPCCPVCLVERFGIAPRRGLRRSL